MKIALIVIALIVVAFVAVGVGTAMQHTGGALVDRGLGRGGWMIILLIIGALLVGAGKLIETVGPPLVREAGEELAPKPTYPYRYGTDEWSPSDGLP